MSSSKGEEVEALWCERDVWLFTLWKVGVSVGLYAWGCSQVVGLICTFTDSTGSDRKLKIQESKVLCKGHLMNKDFRAWKTLGILSNHIILYQKTNMQGGEQTCSGSLSVGTGTGTHGPSQCRAIYPPAVLHIFCRLVWTGCSRSHHPQQISLSFPGYPCSHEGPQLMWVSHLRAAGNDHKCWRSSGQ